MIMYDLGVFPFRVELTGAWADHPFVSSIMKGSVVTINVVNDGFKERSGLASSTRNIAKQLWSSGVPLIDLEKNARFLFYTENSRRNDYISGSQDHIGILYPGITRTEYNGDYWPQKIENIQDHEIIDWLESVTYLIPIKPRDTDLNPRSVENLDQSYVRLLCESGKLCWEAIKTKNAELLGKSMNNSYIGKTGILPATKIKEIDIKRNELLKNSCGVSVSGAGGGGYLTVISEDNINDAITPKIRK